MQLRLELFEFVFSLGRFLLDDANVSGRPLTLALALLQLLTQRHRPLLDLAKFAVKTLLLVLRSSYLGLDLIQGLFRKFHFGGERFNFFAQFADLALESEHARAFFRRAPSRHQPPGDGALACASQRDIRPRSITGTRRLNSLRRVVNYTRFG